MDPSSARFPEATALPKLHEMLGALGIPFSTVPPVNISLFLAIGMCFAVWFLLWRTRLGYQIRAFGESEPAAEYAGISPVRITIYAMLLSGGLAGLMAVNSVLGEQQRLVMNAVEGAGFIGIAVALMGRNHPFGVFLAAILFGFLYQGGAELAFWTGIPRELIVVIQALVILFTGALDNMVRVPIARLFALRGSR
jgi:simple sugar transport system permease protein